MRTFATLPALAIMAGLFAVSFTGCAHGPDNGAERWPGSEPSRPAPEAPVVQQPAYQPPPPPVQPSPATPAYRPIANDQCGASDLQYLIGKPRTDIPVPLQPSQRRVICSTCVTTQDYRATRQTIVFDTDTGLIKSVSCG
ncbi:MAG: hypothetical protein ACXU8U_01665 [Asticcacaulis sp.]